MKYLICVLVAFLSGARNEKNKELAEKIFHRMQKLFPELPNQLTSAAILLANVYASTGHSDKASDIRMQLQQAGLKKKVGVSWTVVDGEIYVNINQIYLLFS
jgi:TRAP-type mannitol/chloroaromatic compound transport system permease large subunit